MKHVEILTGGMALIFAPKAGASHDHFPSSPERGGSSAHKQFPTESTSILSFTWGVIPHARLQSHHHFNRAVVRTY
jgi:hypothetical protein